jgi:hypothetical protein
MDGQLLHAITTGDLPRFRLLIQGGASILETSYHMPALHYAAVLDKKSIVEWLLTEGGANTSNVDGRGFTALLSAAEGIQISCQGYQSSFVTFTTFRWLLEHAGADIADTTHDGRTTVWELLGVAFLKYADRENAAASHLEALLRVMVLRSAPPPRLVHIMSLQHSRIVKGGARLRVELPAYLARRRALVAEHTSLIAPLRALVSSYEEPTTTEELWATGLGALAS